MARLELKGRPVIAIGERDGVAGPSIVAIVEAAGGKTLLSTTACFV